ncbi:hypothetical protein BH09PSE1_BH09PSE1_23080 [soil metagenome]
MKGRNVHILDDDAPFRESLGFLLSAHGYHVTLYAEPAEFLRDHVEDRQACIICDVRMPGMGGIEVARALRERGVNSRIILITGHADPSLVERGLKAGASLLLEKPFAPRRLLEALEALCAPDPDNPPAHQDETVARD